MRLSSNVSLLLTNLSGQVKHFSLGDVYELRVLGFISEPTETDDDDLVGSAYYSAFIRDMRELLQGYPMIHEELRSVLSENGRASYSGVSKLEEFEPDRQM